MFKCFIIIRMTNIRMKLNDLAHYADFFGIIFFLGLFVYLYNKDNKTGLEKIIMACALVGLIIDTIFSIIFLTTK
jgi:hypothetical protein